MRSDLLFSCVALALAAMCVPAQANNIRVENIDMLDQDTTLKRVVVEFDLSWENSWHNNLNHDAAWVFVKFRAPGSNEWEHAYLSTNPAAHAPLPVGAALSVGTTEIGGTERGMGVFIYSSVMQTGTVSYVRTRLMWDYGASGYDWEQGEEIDLSVHAIEMVYVAEGPFYVGSGGMESGSFTEGAWVSGATIPFLITSEDAIEIGPEAGKLWGTSQSGNNTIGSEGTLPAAFPKGFAPFYCMKYSITQGQYVEFLNLLTYAQQNNRINGSPADAPGTYAHGADRHAISIAVSGDVGEGAPATYTTDHPYVACNYLSWMDGAAYADWAGLRPMTELEYEKACRGPAEPVANEYAWGTASISSTGGSANYANLGLFNESVSQGNAIYSGSNPDGPARVGIFATNGATRVSAGATYWGIMEMSGNLWERPVSVGHNTGRNFTGLTGDGKLSANGHASVDLWPGLSVGGEVTGATGAGFRGGNWNSAASYARVSDRISAANVRTDRSYSNGWRAVRPVPSGVGP